MHLTYVRDDDKNFVENAWHRFSLRTNIAVQCCLKQNVISHCYCCMKNYSVTDYCYKKECVTSQENLARVRLLPIEHGSCSDETLHG